MEEASSKYLVGHEIVGATEQRQTLEQFAAPRTIAGVILRHLLPNQDVLDKREGAVRNVLIERHSSLERASPENSRSQHTVVLAVGNHRGHGRNQLGRVLVVRV